MKKIKIISIILFIITFMIFIGVGLAKYFIPNTQRILITNYGTHSTLNSFINGIEEYFEDKDNVIIEIKNANFQDELIAPMFIIKWLDKPHVIITMSTPVSQFAVNSITNIPIIASLISDPISSKILDRSQDNISLISDYHDSKIILHFITTLLSNIKTIGIPYDAYSINEISMLNNFKENAHYYDINIVGIAIDHKNNISKTMMKYINQIDCLFVGISGMISPHASIITNIFNNADIPIIATDKNLVKTGAVLASIGVDYNKLGIKAANKAEQILNKDNKKQLPYYPKIEDYQIYINNHKLTKIQLKNITSEDFTLKIPIKYID